MIYRTFVADNVVSAVIAVKDHILPNFQDRYGHQFTEPNCQNLREILEVDYNASKEIIEDAMLQLDSMNIIKYTKDIWELI